MHHLAIALDDAVGDEQARVQHDAALRKSEESIPISHQTVVSVTAYVVVELSILSPETPDTGGPLCRRGCEIQGAVALVFSRRISHDLERQGQEGCPEGDGGAEETGGAILINGYRS